MEQNKRLNILTTEEISDLYDMPLFTEEERVFYFAIDNQEEKLFDSCKTNTARIHFLLQLAYFKVKKAFFPYCDNKHNSDIDYILNKYFKGGVRPDLANISYYTLHQQRQSILQLYSYRLVSGGISKKLEAQIEYAARVFVKPIFIFKEALKFIENEKLVLPSYKSMQDIIGKCITNEYRRINKHIERTILKTVNKDLKSLLKNSDSLHEITIMKKDAKDFSFGEIKKELQKREALARIYRYSCKSLSELKISSANIQYYGSLIDYYTVAQLKNLVSSKTLIYLLCYAHIRFQKVNDNLIKTFLYLIHNYKEEGKIAAKDRIIEQKTIINESLKQAAEVWSFFTDENIPDQTQFGSVRKAAFKILERKQFPLVQRYIQDSCFDKSEIEWEEWEKLAPRFKKNIHQLITQLRFDSEISNNCVLQAINTISNAIKTGISLNKIASNLATDFIPENICPYIFQKEQNNSKNVFINTDRYEFFVYDQLKEHIEAGDIFCRDSIDYKSFANDLIKRKIWNQKKIELLKKSGLSCLNTDADSFIDSLQERLESAYEIVNQRIRTKSNPHISIKTKKGGHKWSLPYQAMYETDNQILSNISQISINNLLNFIDKHCLFSSAFTHITGHQQRNSVDTQTLFASIIALGTNLGLSKMSSISDMPLSALRVTTGSQIRLETLKNANDIVVNSIAKLPSFSLYHVSENKIHSGSDGQKFETHFDTMKSRYSPKYFGLDKGIVCYTLVADHIPINAKVIGANEHESHYVYDILANNTSDIKPEIHSTDTHGVNNANFFILDCCGYQFAPRYKNLYKKAEDTLVGFADAKKYTKFLIKPSKRVDRQLVKFEWDNIRRIMASLVAKETTQSVLVKKLCSFKGLNRTKSALWEIDSIIESIYILEYIDDIDMRRDVQKALNRVENYHKLRKAIAVAHQGQLRAKTELDLHIWNECSRLLANSVIYFNHLVLSEALVVCDDRPDIIKHVKGCSPVAWSHINFYGRYQFGKVEPISLDNILYSLKL